MKKIFVFFTYAKYTDSRRKLQQNQAIELLSKAPDNVKAICLDFKPSNDGIENKGVLHGIEHIDSLENNSKKTIGNTRPLPFIKEIFNKAFEYVGKTQEVFGYINSDILVPDNVWLDVLQKDYDAFIFSRSDIAEVSLSDFKKGKIKVIYGGDKHSGADGFFFKHSWWKENHELFPENLVVGETEWDTAWKTIIKLYCKNYYFGRNLFHVYHDRIWNKTSPGAELNISIWEDMKKNDKS